MKCSLGISNFLEETSSLSYSIAFLYFFALFTFYLSFGTLHSDGISFIFSFAFSFSSQLFVRFSQTTILPFLISFSWGWSWSLPPGISWTSTHTIKFRESRGKMLDVNMFNLFSFITFWENSKILILWTLIVCGISLKEDYQCLIFLFSHHLRLAYKKGH